MNIIMQRIRVSMLATFILYFNIIITLAHSMTTTYLNSSSATIAPSAVSTIATGARKEFPLKEYLGTVHTKYVHLCNSSTSYLNAVNRCCECNVQECIKYGMCCADILWNFTEVSLQNYFDRLLQEKMKNYKEGVSCGQVLPIKSFQSKYYYIVEKCPPGANPIYTRNCMFSLDNLSIPVWGEDQLLYRNAFCAKCHNVTKFKTIDIDVKCIDAQLLKGKKSIIQVTFDKLQIALLSLRKNLKKNLKRARRKSTVKKTM